MIKSYSFEVSVEIGGKQQIDGIFTDEPTARARAEYLLGLAKYTAVRVIRIDARGTHTSIFQKSYNGSGKALTLGEIDEAYYCTSYHDVYEFQSRKVLLVLMRSYFDEQVVIPSELLHNYMMLRYLERDFLLFNQVGHRIATVQTARTAQKLEDRHEQLRKLFRDVLENAKKNDGLSVYAEALGGGLGYLQQRIKESLPPEEYARAITFAFSQYLAEHRDWARKTAALCKLIDGNPPEETVAWVDQMLAETVDGNTPVRVLVGYAPDLSSALQALSATVHGLLDDRHSGTEALMALSNAIAAYDLPLARGALLNRIALALDAKTPLTRNERGTSVEAFKKLLPHLQEYGGFAGGKIMSAALVRRAKQVFSRGGEDLPLDEAVQALLEYLPHPAARIGFLMDLLGTDLGRRRATNLSQRIASLFSSLKSVKDLAAVEDVSWSIEAVREDFRRRLYAAGIPRHLADNLMRRLRAIDGDVDSREILSGPNGLLLPPDAPVPAPPVREGRIRTATLKVLKEKTETIEKAKKNDLVCRLELDYCGSTYQVPSDHEGFSIGRGEKCDLVVEGRIASRKHLVITFTSGEFIATDQSKNGSCVTWAEDRSVTSFTRDFIPLSETGTLWLGPTPGNGDDDDTPSVKFKRVDIIQLK